LKKYLDDVTVNFEPLIINKGKNTGVIVISLEEYNSLNASQHELSSQKNEIRLDTAIEKLKQGNTLSKTLIQD
jgi:antitoxin YefM